jgi:hypothetical protein
MAAPAQPFEQEAGRHLGDVHKPSAERNDGRDFGHQVIDDFPVRSAPVVLVNELPHAASALVWFLQQHLIDAG